MATRRKKKAVEPPQPEQEAGVPAQPTAVEPKAEAPGRTGWEIVKLSDIIPDGRPMEIDGQPYTLVHPGSLSLYTTAKLDKLRKRFWELFRKWDADQASEKEAGELDRVAVKLVPMVTDVPEAVAQEWRWQTRFKVIMLHFGFIAEVLPNLEVAGMPLPNRAARRRAKEKKETSEKPSRRSATATT